jgi:hypothetical protein
MSTKLITALENDVSRAYIKFQECYFCKSSFVSPTVKSILLGKLDHQGAMIRQA